LCADCSKISYEYYKEKKNLKSKGKQEREREKKNSRTREYYRFMKTGKKRAIYDSKKETFI